MKECDAAGINPPANGEQMGRKVWSQTDHFFHERRLRMSPMVRLKMLASWAGMAAHYTYLGTPEEMAPIFEVQFAHDRRVIGWVDDCPEVPHT